MATLSSNNLVHAAAPLQRRAHARARTVAARAAAAPDTPAGAQSQKEQLAQMRREVQLKSMQPSQANVVNTIIELAQQDFGLAGEWFRRRVRVSSLVRLVCVVPRAARARPRRQNEFTTESLVFFCFFVPLVVGALPRLDRRLLSVSGRAPLSHAHINSEWQTRTQRRASHLPLRYDTSLQRHSLFHS
jgi:hypothetical protein